MCDAIRIIGISSTCEGKITCRFFCMIHNNNHLYLQAQLFHADLKDLAICYNGVHLTTLYFGGSIQSSDNPEDVFGPGNWRFMHTCAMVIAGVLMIIDYQLNMGRMNAVFKFLRIEGAYDHVIMEGLKQQNNSFSAHVWVRTKKWKPTSKREKCYISTFPKLFPVCILSDFFPNLEELCDGPNAEHPVSYYPEDKPGWRSVLNLSYQLQGKPIYPGHHITVGTKQNTVFIGIGYCLAEEETYIILLHGDELEYHPLGTTFENLLPPTVESRELTHKAVTLYAVSELRAANAVQPGRGSGGRKRKQVTLFGSKESTEKSQSDKKSDGTTGTPGTKTPKTPKTPTSTTKTPTPANQTAKDKAKKISDEKKKKAEKISDQKKIDQQNTKIAELLAVTKKLKQDQLSSTKKPEVMSALMKKLVAAEIKSRYEAEAKQKVPVPSKKSLSDLFTSVSNKNDGNVGKGMEHLVASVMVPLVKEVILPLTKGQTKEDHLKLSENAQTETSELRKQLEDTQKRVVTDELKQLRDTLDDRDKSHKEQERQRDRERDQEKEKEKEKKKKKKGKRKLEEDKRKREEEDLAKEKKKRKKEEEKEKEQERVKEKEKKKKKKEKEKKKKEKRKREQFQYGYWGQDAWTVPREPAKEPKRSYNDRWIDIVTGISCYLSQSCIESFVCVV
jgi:hypothetical protein